MYICDVVSNTQEPKPEKVGMNDTAECGGIDPVRGRGGGGKVCKP